MKNPGGAPRLKDIAALVGVSDVTVSNVLRPGKEKRRTLVSEETTRRVLEAARQLGYVPNRVARSMRTRQTGVIGFVTLSFDQNRRTVQNANMQPFLVGLSHVFAPQGRHVALVELNELEVAEGNAMPEALRERFFDALVVHWGLSRSAAHLLEEFKVPIIYWDSGLYLPKNCLYRDEFEVGRRTTNRLLELGHRRIGYFVGSRATWEKHLAGNTPYAAFSLRYEGVTAAMKAYGCTPVYIFGYDAKEHQETILKENLTAFITPAGTYLTLRALAGMEWRVPEDFSSIALDVETSIERRDDITGGASYNRYECGRIAAEMLTRRLESGGDVESVILPFEIVDGSSIGPVPERGGAKKVERSGKKAAPKKRRSK